MGRSARKDCGIVSPGEASGDGEYEAQHGDTKPPKQHSVLCWEWTYWKRGSQGRADLWGAFYRTHGGNEVRWGNL